MKIDKQYKTVFNWFKHTYGEAVYVYSNTNWQSIRNGRKSINDYLNIDVTKLTEIIFVVGGKPIKITNPHVCKEIFNASKKGLTAPIEFNGITITPPNIESIGYKPTKPFKTESLLYKVVNEFILKLIATNPNITLDLIANLVNEVTEPNDTFTKNRITTIIKRSDTMPTQATPK